MAVGRVVGVIRRQQRRVWVLMDVRVVGGGGGGGGSGGSGHVGQVQCAAVRRRMLVALGGYERLDDRGRLVAAVPGGRGGVRWRRRHCEAATAAAAAAAATATRAGGTKNRQ